MRLAIILLIILIKKSLNLVNLNSIFYRLFVKTISDNKNVNKN